MAGSDTPRTDALTIRERHMTNAESRYWCKQYRLLCAELERDLARLTEEIEALREPARMFGELMAIIHRDGGHYLAEHGNFKAYEDAVSKYHAIKAETESLRKAGGIVSDIDWILQKTITGLFGRGDVVQVEETIRAALIEYGALVREECAKKCVEIEMRNNEKFKRSPNRGDPYDEGAADGACECAAAILEK